MAAATEATNLASQFDELQAEVLEAVSRATDEQWQRTTDAEGWTVAATAHHLAIVQRGFVGMVEKLAGGETYTPSTGMEEIHKGNAEHAREYVEADKGETLEILQASGAAMSKLLHDIDNDRLERHAGTFGGNDLTVAQVIQYVVIGHAREHITSIQNTIAG